MIAVIIEVIPHAAHYQNDWEIASARKPALETWADSARASPE
ncbi:hypothetical protein [Rhodoferax aquaticus]|nr:hypothetical protein [Rhodoferax aquaticus]